jgi:hypothetical protein
MAAAGQRQLWLEQIRRRLRRHTGRDDIPLAVTEYNGHFVQENPVRFRQCLANAINNADAIRLMLQPRYQVAMVNFWQFANEYWGMVRGYPHKGDRFVKQANYLVYELIHRHLGQELIAAEVRCERFRYPGGMGVVRCGDPLPTSDHDRSGADANNAQAGGTLEGLARRIWDLGVVARISPAKELGPIDLPTDMWRITDLQGVRQTMQDGNLIVEFAGGKDINYYHARKTLPAKPLTGYRVKIRAKTVDLKGGSAGIQVGDARGWDKTRSCAVAQPLQGTTDWTEVVAEYVTLTDTTAIDIMARRLSGKGAVSGRAEFGAIKVEAFQPDRVSALPELTALASRSPGPPSVVHVILVCKRLDQPLPVRIDRPDGHRVVSAECVTGPTPWATNMETPDTVRIVPLALDKGPRLQADLPPCSLTGLRFEAAK